MGLTNEHLGPTILAKIKIYVLTRAELLFQVCYEIPCSIIQYHIFIFMIQVKVKNISRVFLLRQIFRQKICFD